MFQGPIYVVKSIKYYLFIYVFIYVFIYLFIYLIFFLGGGGGDGCSDVNCFDISQAFYVSVGQGTAS